MASASLGFGEEEQIACVWRGAGELGTEASLREVGCSDECIAATLGYLRSAEAHDDMGSAEVSELPSNLEKVLSMLSTTEDGQAMLLATLGRGITSSLNKLALPIRMGPSNLNEATALCINLSSNTNIKELHLRSKAVFRTLQGCTLLAAALKSNSTIHHLSLRSCGIETGETLACLLDGLRANDTLRTVDLSYNALSDEGIAYVAEFLRTNVTLTSLNLYETDSGFQGAEHMAAALERNNSLEELCFGGNSIGRDGMKILLEPLSQKVGHEGAPTGPKNTTLKTLDLRSSWPRDFSAESVRQMVKTNKSLSNLVLSSSPLLREDWVKIFDALKENETIEELDLSHCRGGLKENHVYDCLMDLLKFSTTGLRRIKLEGSSLQIIQGRVDEELRVNRQYRGQLRGQAKLKTRSGRLVLCGSEGAGKTTIRKTMQRIEHGTAFSCELKKVMTSSRALQRCLFGFDAHRERTTRKRGFDILNLSTQTYLASVWDFAGQREYFAFHGYLFPRVINSCFLYICNSRFPPDFTDLRGKVKDQSSMREECQFWMRLIASNSKPRQVGDNHGRPQNLPRVKFVLTHKDTLDSDTLHISEQWAKDTVRELREKFKDVIDLDHSVEVVNGHCSEDVRRLIVIANRYLKTVFRCIKPSTYAVCEAVREAVKNWSAKNPTKPFMTLQEFKSICGNEVRRSEPKVYKEAQLHTSDGRKTVLSYLNDTGDLIYPKGLDFIVTKPRCFGLGVLGSLIDAFGGAEDLQQPRGTMYTGILGHLSRSGSRSKPKLPHQEGFVEREDIKNHLELSLNTHNLPSDKLIQLMIHLELCFEMKGGNETSPLFIPALIDDEMGSAGKGKRKLEWKLKRAEPFHCIYLGRRLECENKSVTFLPPGFFPKLQVHLLNYVRERNWTGNPGFEVGRNLISFAENGIEVCVEYSGDIDFFVDILVRSSKPYAVALRFTEEYVVKTIVNFCASPQGCQGVLLVEAVIRPVCVERLHLCIDRKHHSVLVSDLKAHLAEHDDYEHIWSHGIEHVKDTDFARDLLEGSSYRGSNSSTGSENQFTTGHEYLSSVRRQQPRLFYPSLEDVSWLRKFYHRLNVADVMPIKLHLLCDHKDGSHKVEGQPGKNFRLNWRANSYDLPLAKFAVTLLWAGVGVSVGIASSGANLNLPQVDSWIQSLFDVPGFPDISAETLNQLMNGSESRKPLSKREILNALERYLKIDPYTEGLKKILNLQDGDKFWKDFQLRKVVYTEESHQNRIGWVCDRHYNSGLQERILQSVPLSIV